MRSKRVTLKKCEAAFYQLITYSEYHIFIHSNQSHFFSIYSHNCLTMTIYVLENKIKCLRNVSITDTK